MNSANVKCQYMTLLDIFIKKVSIFIILVIIILRGKNNKIRIKFSVKSNNVFAMFLAHLMVHVPKSNVASMMPQPRLVTELPALEFWIQRGYTPVRESHTGSADNMMTSCLKVLYWITATLWNTMEHYGM